MPVSRVNAPPPVLPQDIFAPDKNAGDVISCAPTFAMEDVEGIPDNFNELPIEEQQRIQYRLRFRGIRLRADLPFETIPLTKDTLDIP